MEAHYLGDISNDSLGRGGKALIDRVERPASPLAASLPARAGAAVLRGLHELAARLWSSLWLIVAVAVIMALERKVQYMGYYQRNFNNVDMATL